MSDILIRGMEMPETCCECDLKIYDPKLRWDENGIEQIGAWVCKRTGEIIWNTRRGESCPFFPLPKGHGRLVDADAFCKQIANSRRIGGIVAAGIISYVEHAPTIVPAEGGADECSEN